MMLIYIILLRLVRIYSILLIIYALLSWFPGAYQTRIGQVIMAIVEPTLAPFRRLNLRIAGLDFTIIVVLFALQILLKLISYLLLF